jgi:hypothetical protein
MPARPRIDLDGVTLLDASGSTDQVIAVMRHRTKQGLVVLVPESADTLVPWANIKEAQIDLAEGSIKILLDPKYVAQENWLRGVDQLKGQWMDRLQLDAKDLGLG